MAYTTAQSFASVVQLVADIEQYLVRRNANPRTYKWRAEGQAILAKIQRARQDLAEVHTS